MTELFTLNNAIALAMLTLLEIVLGIDNIVFIAIVADRVEESKRAMVRRVGLGLALIGRVAFLFAISWILALEDASLFTALGHPFSWADLVLLAGGLFLLYKATKEIHHLIEHAPEKQTTNPVAAGVAGVILQILALDLVFSIDSVITAVGMADHIAVMITAVSIAIGVMIIAAGPIANFVRKHPAIKMLCLAFLVLIGASLVADSFGQHIPRGYIYAAIGFSLFVEFLQMRATKNTPQIQVLPDTPADRPPTGSIR